ncbi:MAG: hypothetical protein B5M56_00515 [Desulfococcus sp. 4484_241]|nr:MAG: hypothetical protein B5M56_00515 [Desulfococcus sp. 4484_241]
MGKAVKETDGITTFLGRGASVDGIVSFEGTIRVDGRVKGKISSHDGTLIVGEKAAIDGDIDVAVAVVRGMVTGTIVAGSRIEVYPPAVIDGDIHAPVISIDAGVKFNGNCVMKQKDDAAGRPAGKDTAVLVGARPAG